MKLSAVLLARTLAFFDVHELNPRGRLYFPALVPHIVERFGFSQFPSEPKDFDEKNGIAFKEGFYGGMNVDELTLYGDGIKIDVRSSTEDGRAILLDTLEWLSLEHGVHYDDSSINRWAFVSNLSFESGIDLDVLSPVLTNLKERLNAELRGDGRALRGVRVNSVHLDIDRSYGSTPISSFTIERRKNIDFSKGKFFSAAPLPTATHLKILEQFEADCLAQNSRK